MLTIDYRDKRPIYEQIIERVEELVSKGVYHSGEQLPSVRSLATELSINPNTIQRAYAQLDKLGVTYSVKGKGSFISQDLQRVMDMKKREYFFCLDNAVQNLLLCGTTKREIMDQCNFYIIKTEGESESR